MDDKTSEPVLGLALALPFACGEERRGVLAVYRASRNNFTTEGDLASLMPVCGTLGRILAAAKPQESEAPLAQPSRALAAPVPSSPLSGHVSPRVEVPA
jgi:hypothetical protein